MNDPAGKSVARAEARRLVAGFEALGAREVETAILQPADALLDLYGEDIRARAYVTSDPLRGEMMLRPDFTLPIVRMHMEGRATPARYAYAGEVFRRQEAGDACPNEYIQAGFELFGGDGPEADAEVLAALMGALPDLGLRTVMGDVGLLLAAVGGLSTTPARKAALAHHIWRPRRFRALLDGWGRASVAHPALALADPFADAGPEIGLRGRDEVEARLTALREDAGASPIPAAEIAGIDAILALAQPAPAAFEALEAIVAVLPAIGPAVARLGERLAALSARSVDVGAIGFDGGHGQGAMEYYDGMVFSLMATGRPDLPPVATGGRYDALTLRLGAGEGLPAVGGVIRPETVVRLRGLA